MGKKKIQVLRFADDLSILESLLNDTKRTTQVFEKAASKIGLKINNEKTKLMK